MATQSDIATQMLAQLRILDPSASGEIGTPERKILDTVAQAIADSQIDVNILNGSLDINAKYGSDLDKFVGIFGFGRQTGASATGFVTFSRTTASTYDITIPRNTLVLAPSVTSDSIDTSITYTTTDAVTLPAGSLSVIAPVQATIIGAIGNVAANIITAFAVTPVLGITGVTNDVPTTNGVDQESDDELKIRFKNTVFRNLSGTSDQYLALAVSTAYTTKANVVGPISRYQEYIQVPDVDDASADPDSGITGNGNAGEYTSALSSNPYGIFIYDTVPYFVSNGTNNIDTVFYRNDTDFVMNITNKDRGDTYRGHISGSGPNPNTDPTTNFQPNVTFRNVYTGDDNTVTGIRPRDVVLFEYSYMSSASRNDWNRNITNCIDVFINGTNPTTANAIIPRPSPTINLFTSVTTDRFYYDNYRRTGEPLHRPVLGNVFTALYWQPVIDLPQQIVMGTVTYLKGIHYWAVEDVSHIGNTVRTRNGIEWAIGVPGLASTDDPTGNPGDWTGAKVFFNDLTALTITGYTYDKNIIDLQGAMEASKQVTTDVLAHRAITRYFKLDITVMYSTGSSVSDVNATINSNVQNYMAGLYFGSTIQLSDLLQVIHNAPGVDNVRWSKEILISQGVIADHEGNPRDRVVECDANGNPLQNVLLSRRTAGNASTAEVWEYYLPAAPTGGTYTLSYAGNTTAALAYNASTTAINSALSTASISGTVTGSGTPVAPFVFTFGSNGARSNLTADGSRLTGGSPIFNSDFFLSDDELPALPTGQLVTDSVPGLVVRPRAQNVWNQL